MPKVNDFLAIHPYNLGLSNPLRDIYFGQQRSFNDGSSGLGRSAD